MGSIAQTNNGINSKERVKSSGEVFTPDSIVCDMLKLCEDELKKKCKNNNEFICSTFLEPACGDGQFLIRILSSKLANIQKCKNITNEEKKILVIKALQSIYGIDILQDNVEQSKNRMLKIILGETVTTFDLKNKTNEIQVELGIDMTSDFVDKVKETLDTNIMCGDTLKAENSTHGKLYIRKYEYIDKNKVHIVDIPFDNLGSEFGAIDIGTYNILDKYGGSSGNSQNYNQDEEYDF